MGAGRTKEEAALIFVEEMMKQFPNKKGAYEFFIRAPIDYEVDKDFLSATITHKFYFRGSCLLLEEFEKIAGFAQ